MGLLCLVEHAFPLAKPWQGLTWWVLVRTPGQKELTQADPDLIIAKIRWGRRSRLIDGIVLYQATASVQMNACTGNAHVSPTMSAIL